MELEAETLHLIALSFSFIVILIADHEGYTYFRGKVQTLDKVKLERLHRYVWIGLIGMILTGFILLTFELDVLFEPAFYVKMLMVSALVVNGFFIGKLSHIATTTSFKNLTLSQKLPLLISGVVSSFCWLGAATIGLFFI